jgi:hypothetical protein
MLWYKSWLDTRWRFLLTLAVLVVLACASVFSYETMQRILAAVPQDADLPLGDSLQEELREAIEVSRTFRGYAWSQWFGGNLGGLLTLAAALLGSGSPLVKSGSGALFSLALPVSRGRWIATRAGVGLVELLVIALLPSVAISALAPFVGQQFSIIDAFIYGLCAFVVATVFFGAAVYVSTLFNDVWRPLLITCLLAIAVAMAGTLLPKDHGLFAAMEGRSYFYEGSLPWAELLTSAAAAAALVYAAASSIARRDF